MAKMRTRMARRAAAALALGLGASALAAMPAAATEQAYGRYLVGLWAGPGGAIVPPYPGFYWSSNNFYYSGKASAQTQIPIGAKLRAGFEADMISASGTVQFVPDFKVFGATLGTAITVPIGKTTASARLSLGPFARERTDELDGLGDIMLTPVVLGWNSGPNFFSMGLRVWAPTGEYKKKSFAQVGLNYWTFSPNVAYTWFDPSVGFDFTTAAGVDINLENPATNYTSGAMGHLDVTATKYFNESFGMGVFGSVLYQFEDDECKCLPKRLDGFKGQSYSIGPLMKWTIKTDKSEFYVQASWAPEFWVKNRTMGNALYASVSGKF